MKRFVKRNIKYILTALLLVVFLCSVVRGIRIRSVSEVRQESEELAGMAVHSSAEPQDNGLDTDSDGRVGPGNLVAESSESEVAERAGSTDDAADRDGQTEDSGAVNTDSSEKNTQAAGDSGGQSDVPESKGASGKNQNVSSGQRASARKDGNGSTGKQGSVQNTGKSGKKQTKEPGTGSTGRKISDGSGTKPDQYHTDPVPSGRPEPVNTEDQSVNQKRSFYVYLSIDVKTILNHMDDLKQGLEKYVPEDGWILPKTRVLCYEGETAWDVMSRECKARGINVQSSYTALYHSVYMEGINHIREFDCGAASGWVYEVDGWIPNYSSSRYVMVEGEYLRWRYSCTGFGSDLDGVVR
ncbi:MAG: DUF4430 domain-containing protein [Lachnospiraceae bacterium]|nr:DUF4430 domain-containing protein [Lachnospiraceae bacterium]